ncbi:hypothetical protein FDUTEX481_05981 [Tolypothrix sp. PCC 7601]|nr:hypothetical protein FDUTEX481_05981 [Tolypothrix sp. PCC 7601]
MGNWCLQFSFPQSPIPSPHYPLSPEGAPSSPVPNPQPQPCDLGK